MVVEKHFEKSLANFQPAPLSVSSPSIAEYDCSLPKSPLDLSLRAHETEDRPCSGCSYSDSLRCSPSNSCSFNPKKKWMEKYVQVGDPYWQCTEIDSESSTRTGSCPHLFCQGDGPVFLVNKKEKIKTTGEAQQQMHRSINLTLNVDSPNYASSSPSSYMESRIDLTRSRVNLIFKYFIQISG